MSQPFIGEVRLVGFNFAPVGWQICQGQLVSISESSALYSLIGTTYGGDGQVNFGLPNLQGRLTVHQGQTAGLGNYVMGETAGVEQVTILTQNYPSHTHSLVASSSDASVSAPSGNALGGNVKIYDGPSGTNALNALSVSFAGGTGPAPHENRQPYLALNWIIAMDGIFPSQG